MDIKSCYKIARIIGTHGLKGGMTLYLEPDAPSDLSTIETLFVHKNGHLLPVFVHSISPKGTRAYLQLENITTIDEAASYKNSDLYLPKADRPKAKKGTFYDDEVIGFMVEDEQEGQIGTVTKVTSIGANRLLIVDYAGKEVMIPVNAPYIKTITRASKKITVELPSGFLEI